MFGRKPKPATQTQPDHTVDNLLASTNAMLAQFTANQQNR